MAYYNKYFYVLDSSSESQFRKEMETQWIKSDNQLNENYVVVQGLDPGFVYHFRVVAVDGVYETPSTIQGWKFMNCIHCQELGQQASWLLIGCTRVNNQSRARSVS